MFEASRAQTILSSKRTLWVIGALIIWLFAIANLPWHLDDYDQAKQAFTSFEIIKEGRWFYQKTPHEHVATKPPLVGWISAALFASTRSWDLAWRLPSFLAAIATAILLFLAATFGYGRIAGLIAVSAFGLNLLSPRLATLVRTDMPLAFVIFLIGLLIWQKIRAKTEWKPRDRVYLFVLLTVGMLIKGPIVYAFLLPGIALFQWRYGRARHAAVAGLGDLGDSHKQLGHIAWPGPPQDGFAVADWWPWVASLGIFLLWVAGGILFQPGFFHGVVIREFIARFGETIHRPQPFYFYLPHLLHKFAPWSILMLAIAIADLHSRKWRLRAAFREMSPETFWLLCWSLGGLIVMSLIASKRVDRIFPVIPPLCLLLTAQISGREAAPRRLLGTARQPYLWSTAALVIAISVTGGYTIAKVISGYRDHRDALAIFGRDVRREAAANHWRYEVVSAKDEGLLLYLQKTHFIQPDHAVTEWNRDNLDALVAPTEKTRGLMRDLRDAALSQWKSTERKKEQGSGYVLIRR